jgi:hypothetical protein
MIMAATVIATACTLTSSLLDIVSGELAYSLLML